jgi:hypothetical protein
MEVDEEVLARGAAAVDTGFQVEGDERRLVSAIMNGQLPLEHCLKVIAYRDAREVAHLGINLYALARMARSRGSEDMAVF